MRNICCNQDRLPYCMRPSSHVYCLSSLFKHHGRREMEGFTIVGDKGSSTGMTNVLGILQILLPSSFCQSRWWLALWQPCRSLSSPAYAFLSVASYRPYSSPVSRSSSICRCRQAHGRHGRMSRRLGINEVTGSGSQASDLRARRRREHCQLQNSVNRGLFAAG